MSNVEIEYKSSNRSHGKWAGVSEILDTWLSNAVGTTVWRGATAWQIGPMTYEVVPLVGVVSTSGGGIAAWQPAVNLPVVVLRCLVNITTVSTGAANLSVGTAANATTSATNLVTASDVHTAAILLDSLTLQAAAVAAEALLMTAGQYITFTGSGSTVGMVGSALITYWKP